MKKKLILPLSLLLGFAVWLILLQTVDVAAIGPCGSKVGLSHLNAWGLKAFGEHLWCYTVTQILGYAAVLTVVVFASFGAVQLFTRRNLWKVDVPILTLGVICLTLAILYVVFEAFPVNFRPVLLEGESAPAPSFPSSHTMLACSLFGSLFFLVGYYLKGKPVKTVRVLLSCLIAAALAGRIFSGVHWLSDIIASALLSGGLVSLYAVCTAYFTKLKKD